MRQAKEIRFKDAELWIPGVTGRIGSPAKIRTLKPQPPMGVDLEIKPLERQSELNKVATVGMSLRRTGVWCPYNKSRDPGRV